MINLIASFLMSFLFSGVNNHFDYFGNSFYTSSMISILFWTLVFVSKGDTEEVGVKTKIVSVSRYNTTHFSHKNKL